MTAILIFVVIAAIVIICVWYGTNTKKNEHGVHSHVIVQPVKEVVEEFTDDGYLKLNPANAGKLLEKVKSIEKALEDDQYLSFKKDGKFLSSVNFCVSNSNKFYVYYPNGEHILVTYDNIDAVCEKYGTNLRIKQNGQLAFNQVQDFLNNGELVKNQKEILNDKITSNGWYKTVDGEYYLNAESTYVFQHRLNKFTMFDFQTWSSSFDKDHIAEQLKDKEIVKCEDPRKEHWQHFLHLEMLEKQKHQQECHKFVDRILAKQVEYNDLQLKYEMIPSAPIVDTLTFKNFCDMVHEDIEFEDFEIQNYLLVKQQKH